MLVILLTEEILNASPFVVRIGSVDKEDINTIHMTIMNSPPQGCFTIIVFNINSQLPMCSTLTDQQQAIQNGLAIINSSIMDYCPSHLREQGVNKSVRVSIISIERSHCIPTDNETSNRMTPTQTQTIATQTHATHKSTNTSAQQKSRKSNDNLSNKTHTVLHHDISTVFYQ